MGRLDGIKEDVLPVSSNQELIRMLYPALELSNNCEFAYIAYIDRNIKLPIQGLFSDDVVLLKNRIGIKKGLETFLSKTDNSAFTNLVFFLDAYKNHKSYGLSLSVAYEPNRFGEDAVMDDILKDSRGYITWHHQLEGLIRIFSNIPDKAVEMRKGLNRQDPACWESIKKFQFADGRALFDVYNERKMAPVTSYPQYQEAYNLHSFLSED
jgi:hypothetical protein